MPCGLGLHQGFLDDGRGGVGEGGEDAAGMQPADAALGEEIVEIDIAGLHVHRGGVAAIVHGDAAADAAAHFGEVQPDAVGLAHAVVRGDGDRGDIHAHGAGVIENQLAQRIIDQAAGPAGAQAQSREGVGDVVFPAADPDFQHIGEFDAAVSRGRQANHAFAQGDQVKLSGIFGFDVERHYFHPT